MASTSARVKTVRSYDETSVLASTMCRGTARPGCVCCGSSMLGISFSTSKATKEQTGQSSVWQEHSCCWGWASNHTHTSCRLLRVNVILCLIRTIPCAPVQLRAVVSAAVPARGLHCLRIPTLPTVQFVYSSPHSSHSLRTRSADSRQWCSGQQQPSRHAHFWQRSSTPFTASSRGSSSPMASGPRGG